MDFPEYAKQSIRNALIVGRLATEICHRPTLNGDKEFVGFRPIDAGTIYRAVPGNKSTVNLRRQAIERLKQIKNKRIDPKLFAADKYKWIQVIKDQPVQAFTEDECIVHSFYDVPDVEANKYPVTPIDTMIAAVTSHINLSTSNKLFFQNGRTSKGMLVVKSDNATEAVVARIRQQFNSMLNGVNNSASPPIFGVGSEDEISWQAMDTSARDMEFQYMCDMTSRIILSAFQMSPDELPGYGHLSRNANQQSLSESNNQFKLEAARDAGLVPLMAQFEDFVNQHILPLIDPVVAKLCVFKMVGLNSDSYEKEALRLQEDMAIHLSFDEILSKVEKDPIGKNYGGEFPLNPNFQQILDKYLSVGEIKEKFFGIKNASKDPNLVYYRDQYWFQWQQLVMQNKQLTQQQQMQEDQLKQQQAQIQPQLPGVDQQQQGQEQQQQEAQPQQNNDEDGDLPNIIEQGLKSLDRDK